jgi:hypothetical protein
MATTISTRIARDRGVASFFAFIAALPAIAGILAMGYLAYYLLTDPSSDLNSDGGYFWLGVLAVFAFLFFILARWSFAAVRSALTPQRVQAMWLRRFQSEKGAFRTSRVIDQLSRHGVAALTLQDRDVQLSFEQRRNRLAGVFWILFIPIAAALAYFSYQGWVDAVAQIQENQPSETFREAMGELFGDIFALIVVTMLLVVGVFLGVLVAMAGVMLFALLAGPIGAIFARNRDDFRALPNLLKRIARGKGRRGASIVRVSDAHWRDAVTSSLGAVDVAIIDLSDVSDHVAWEISEAVKACGAEGLVFICREGVELTDGAKAAVRAALGREHIQLIQYPAQRNARANAFAHDLRTHIYSAAELRKARA